MIRALLFLLVIAFGLSGVAFAKNEKRKQPEPPLIQILINGTPLSSNPSPLYLNGRVYVPLRRILDALGLDFTLQGSTVVTHVSDRTVSLRLGSAQATIDDMPVTLDSPPVEVKDTLFVPLRFITDALRAQAIYNSVDKKVEITSTVIGKTGAGISRFGAQTQTSGTVSAVDFNSAPPSITLTAGSSVHTIAINSSARVTIKDVVANTAAPGVPENIHVGDHVDVFVNKDGSVARIITAYASRSGSIAASAGNFVVLSDGHVITPTSATTISLNGDPAKIGDLKIGDTITVRYNVDTTETRQIIAFRKIPVSVLPAGGVAISSIEILPDRPLRAGQSLSVRLTGTPGGRATFDIGPYFTGLPMREEEPGNYRATYSIPQGVNLSAVSIFGHLTLGGLQAPRAESSTQLSASSSPPRIVDVAPDDGSAVNNPRPSIYATFFTNDVPVNPSTVRIIINGHDVTSSATRSATFITYNPSIVYPAGPVRITVRVSDLAGNTATKSWTFTIRSR
ncbi:MAG: copper amine oxidase N-terminal domain-containing protein [Candidatus Eremiobacteraeota bacterium]|nr:copper amine oxidase N-terminal domain-containing protein [Candidatus Eremiobacteraeota bacterium]